MTQTHKIKTKKLKKNQIQLVWLQLVKVAKQRRNLCFVSAQFAVHFCVRCWESSTTHKNARLQILYYHHSIFRIYKWKQEQAIVIHHWNAFKEIHRHWPLEILRILIDASRLFKYLRQFTVPPTFYRNRSSGHVHCHCLLLDWNPNSRLRNQLEMSQRRAVNVVFELNDFWLSSN